jgi:uroporphyrinogen III methyltransferase/synthase
VPGKVYLVGAGPGDPKLITVKGLECIAWADCIIYDRLATNLLFKHAKADAEFIYVGKHDGKHILKQDDINRLLVEKANDGKTVVRLKGGDPLIFGRGGEEAVALVDAGIEFEFVPGVSAGNAVPAYAGIPVTQRGITSTVAFVTGHEDPAKPTTDIDWQSLAGIGTVIFYMGMRNLSKIVEQLMRHGRPSDTPVAVIRWGTTPQQKTVIGTLATIADAVEEAKIKAPSIIIVGEVVGLREKLSWFEKKPLFGKRVLITRAKSQAKTLSDLIYELGGQPIEVPTIKIVDPDSFANIDRAIERLDGGNGYDWVIFTSVNGVKCFIKRMAALKKDIRILSGARVAVIGPATAKAVKKLLINIDITPAEFVAEGLLAEFEKTGIAGARILIPRALVARDILPGTLREMGAHVDVAEVYQTVLDEAAGERIRQMLAEKSVDIATFTSSSTVTNFVELVGPKTSELMHGVTVAAIGPVTAETIGKSGLSVDIMASEYTIPGLVDAIVRYYAITAEA